MAYGEKQFQRDKVRFRSHRMQVRSPAGYERFLNYQSARKAAEAVAKEKQTPTPAPTPAPSPAPSPAPTVTPNIPPQQTSAPSSFDTAISSLNTRIADLTSGFQTQLGTLTTQMQQEREAASKRMEEMQGNFAQALAQRDTRPRVEGIRTPDRGTGGASQQQLQRRGVRGSFGRAGDRLMKISSLNV